VDSRIYCESLFNRKRRKYSQISARNQKTSSRAKITIDLGWRFLPERGGNEEAVSERKRRKKTKEWSITCQLFAPYAPAENPVEGIWLPVKNFIRRFYHICTNFSIVKRLFEFFFDFKLFNNPNLKNYDAFAQLI
jgi:transposase